MCGDVEKDLQLRAAGDQRLTMDDLLQVTLQQLASLVDELLGKVARNLLWWKEVFVDSVLLHQLQMSTHSDSNG